MAVYDRWHLTHPDPARDKPCKCGRGRNRLYPSIEHGVGKRWQVRWADGEGKSPRRNFTERYGDDPETCAEAFDAKVRHEVNAGTYIDPAAGKITLESYARQWRAGLTIDPGTLGQLDSRLRKWVYGTPMAAQEMRTLAKRPSLVQAWVKGLEPHLEASTIQGIVGWVSTIFQVAMVDGVVARNPVKTDAVRPPRPERRLVVPWTIEQVRAARAALPARFAAMADLGAGAALRQGEIFGVARGDIELMLHVRRQVRIIEGQLVFSPPKGGRTRTAPLGNLVRQALKDHMRDHPPVPVTLPWVRPGGRPVTVELLFTTEAGEALERSWFNEHCWRPARRAAGVPQTRANGMHVLRHTAASAWLAGGEDIKKVASWLGHADAGFTLNTYIHLVDRPGQGIASMDAFLGGGRSALDLPAEAGG